MFNTCFFVWLLQMKSLSPNLNSNSSNQKTLEFSQRHIAYPYWSLANLDNDSDSWKYLNIMEKKELWTIINNLNSIEEHLIQKL